jgi:hypothetical protein
MSVMERRLRLGAIALPGDVAEQFDHHLCAEREPIGVTKLPHWESYLAFLEILRILWQHEDVSTFGGAVRSCFPEKLSRCKTVKDLTCRKITGRFSDGMGCRSRRSMQITSATVANQ